MTGNVRKERMLPQIIVSTCDGEGIETQTKLIEAAKWWLLSQLQKYTL